MKKALTAFLCCVTATGLLSCKSTKRKAATGAETPVVSTGFWRGSAPSGLSGRTLTLQVPVETMSAGAATLPVSYRFRKSTQSEPSAGGLVLTYQRTGKSTATATLSGNVSTVYVLNFRNRRSGKLTVQRPHGTAEGRFTIR